MLKKILAFVLCIAAIATLFVGCNKPEETTAPKGVFEVGYARVDVTPDPKNSYNLAGYGYKRYSEGVDDPLYVTCTAMKDENGATFILFHCDFLKTYNALLTSKTQISKNTGVPLENIMISATHNHTAPSLDDPDDAVMADYAKIVKKGMIKAAENAVADLKPARMYTTEIDVEGFNEIRSIGVSSNLGDELDKTFEMIKITREGCKDIIMVNWQGHPCAGGGATLKIRSDVDALRRFMEPALNCEIIFFLGSSGNVNNKLLKKNDETWTYVENYEALALKAVEASANFKEVTSGAITKATTRVELDFKSGGGKDNPAISVISIGKSIAFAIVPYEMFSSSAKEIKAYSKFDQTFIVTCADGHIGYLPTMAIDPDEYEAGVTQYMLGSAELLVDGYKTLLDQQYAK